MNSNDAMTRSRNDRRPLAATTAARRLLLTYPRASEPAPPAMTRTNASKKSHRVARTQAALKRTTQDGVPQTVAKPLICMSMGIASEQKSLEVVVSSNKPSTRAHAPITAGTAQSRGRASIVIGRERVRVVYWARWGCSLVCGAARVCVVLGERPLRGSIFFVGQQLRETARMRPRGDCLNRYASWDPRGRLVASFWLLSLDL
ncbi:unnamed protein product, partial [Pelagomonas calceolata]